MLKVRVIPVLLLRDGRMVKPKQFGAGGERDVGYPATTARIYDSQNADELVFIDLSAGAGRAFLLDTLKEIAQQCFIPITAGGGIRSLDDVQEVLKSGADKVSINTEALRRPEFITEIAKRYGSQCVVVSIDVRKENGVYEVYCRGGAERAGWTAVAWAKEAAQRGAGELLLTSIDNEGMMGGYELALIKEVSAAVTIPVIAHGGSGNRQDFVDAVWAGSSAVAAASIFHFSDSNLSQVKSFMHNAGLPVRL